ncbi:two-component regulator propeller domain-containing protein [Chitinispirillales bacterium ANBcel5]|uniref:ligand-binding sensor domain-containing protein n=1 Tax=Cellulosispirillum alkaliphilum TaxID=3039283 RepID=UPI002A528C80|nr:two-component regulator propeller domain-containing protein [Chitinispirillales bacterium ANBcel5]
MLKRLIPVLALSAIFSVQGDEVVADSISYETPVEWQIFSAPLPVNTFALQGQTLWYATDEEVVAQPLRQQRVQNYTQLGSVTGVGVTSIVTDASGNVWFGSPEGVAVRRGNSFSSYTEEDGLPGNNVLSVAAAPNGGVWVGTESGAALYSNGSWQAFTTEDGLAGDKVQALVVDSKGTVWFGTNRGISEYNGTSWTTHDMRSGLSWNDTKALGYDERRGVVWAAVGERDVNSFDGNEWRVFMGIEPDITSIMVDTSGRVWFGTRTGLLRFNGEIWVDDIARLGPPVAQVFGMHMDQSGNLWFAMESGVLRYSNPYR